MAMVDSARLWVGVSLLESPVACRAASITTVDVVNWLLAAAVGRPRISHCLFQELWTWFLRAATIGIHAQWLGLRQLEWLILPFKL